jgi:hypothetical protein
MPPVSLSGAQESLAGHRDWVRANAITIANQSANSALCSDRGSKEFRRLSSRERKEIPREICSEKANKIEETSRDSRFEIKKSHL